jgi:hypothetical protein
LKEITIKREAAEKAIAKFVIAQGGKFRPMLDSPQFT